MKPERPPVLVCLDGDGTFPSVSMPGQTRSLIAEFYGRELAYFSHLHHVSLVREVAVRTAISDRLSRFRATST